MYENQPTKTSVVMQHIKVQSFCAFEDKHPKNISCGYLKNEGSYIHLYIYMYNAMQIKINHVLNIHNLFFRKHMED